MRDGAYQTKLPAIKGRIEHLGNFYSAHDFSSSQSMTKKPVKFTLPGPLTIMDTSADCFYNDRIKLNTDLAETLNQEILQLVQAGCNLIQIDEPLFARQVEDALLFGMEGVERCFHKVPNDVTKIIHICCGYTDHLDDELYKKLTCVIQLSKPEDYEGGEFWVRDKSYKPEKGSAIIFPSNFMFPHEAGVVTKGTRWSIVTWLM